MLTAAPTGQRPALSQESSIGVPGRLGIVSLHSHESVLLPSQ